MYNIGEFQLPLLIGKKQGDNISIDRYAGVGFYLNESGLIATCKHVIEEVGDSECLMAKDLVKNQPYVLEDISIHPTKDFGVCKINNGGNKCLSHYENEVITGQDVRASGFTNNGKDGENVIVDVRFFKGHIVRISPESNRPEANSICEISFPVLSGFSGAPLITEAHGKLIGMLYGNMATTILLHGFSEFSEDGVETKEAIYRVMELGLAHTVTDINVFMSDLGLC